MNSDDTLAQHKRNLWSAMHTIAESTPETLAARLARIYHPDARWRGSHPWNEVHGVAAIERVVWAPLLHCFPDLERRDDIVIGGSYDGRDYVGCVGHLAGSFRRDWNGIPATDQVIYLRYGEFHQMAQGKIIQSTVLVDILDFIRQAGFWPLAPSLGQEGPWQGPLGRDGLVFAAQDASESAASLKLTLDMQASLGAYDDTTNAGRAGLLNMPQKQFWHPRMMWYGPSGIGTTRGLDGFVDYHQLPFRTTFPNAPRAPKSPARTKDGNSHYVRIGDGKYSATGGWPSRYVNHAGGGWLGLPPTNRAITMRVMDFYCADEGLIRENWVPIDIIEVLLQLDIDVLARVRSQFGRRRRAAAAPGAAARGAPV